MKTQNNSLECLQDGLFFGLSYLKETLPATGFSSYCDEGRVIFKGQKALYMEESPQKETIGFLLSYLSGAYTLISCFMEKNFDFKIGASSTKGFLYKEGEEQAILKAGACRPAKDLKKQAQDLESIIKRTKKQNMEGTLLLSGDKISLPKIKKVLQDFPNQDFSVSAHLLPSDLEGWREFKNIQAVYPYCLQGSFPLLKMQWTA